MEQGRLMAEGETSLFMGAGLKVYVPTGSNRRSSDMVEYGCASFITAEQQQTLDLLQSHVQQLLYSETDASDSLDRSGLDLVRDLVTLGVFAVDASMENLFVLHRPGNYISQVCLFTCIPASVSCQVHQIKQVSLSGVSLECWRRVVRFLCRSGLLHLVRFSGLGSIEGVAKMRSPPPAASVASLTSRVRSAPGQGKSPTRRSVRTLKKKQKAVQVNSNVGWTLSLPDRNASASVIATEGAAPHHRQSRADVAKTPVCLTQSKRRPSQPAHVAADAVEDIPITVQSPDENSDLHTHVEQHALAACAPTHQTASVELIEPTPIAATGQLPSERVAPKMARLSLSDQLAEVFSQLRVQFPTGATDAEAIREYLEDVKEEHIDWLTVDLVVEAIERIEQKPALAQSQWSRRNGPDAVCPIPTIADISWTSVEAEVEKYEQAHPVLTSLQQLRVDGTEYHQIRAEMADEITDKILKELINKEVAEQVKQQANVLTLAFRTLDQMIVSVSAILANCVTGQTRELQWWFFAIERVVQAVRDGDQATVKLVVKEAANDLSPLGLLKATLRVCVSEFGHVELHRLRCLTNSSQRSTVINRFFCDLFTAPGTDLPSSFLLSMAVVSVQARLDISSGFGPKSQPAFRNGRVYVITGLPRAAEEKPAGNGGSSVARRAVTAAPVEKNPENVDDEVATIIDEQGSFPQTKRRRIWSKTLTSVGQWFRRRIVCGSGSTTAVRDD